MIVVNVTTGTTSKYENVIIAPKVDQILITLFAFDHGPETVISKPEFLAYLLKYLLTYGLSYSMEKSFP
jgi:hypothetical protein